MKWLDLVMTVLGIISLAGSVFAMYILAQVSEAINALTSFDTTGLGVSGFESIVSTFQFFIAVGWVWTIIVFLTSLYAVYVGIKRLRAPAKK